MAEDMLTKQAEIAALGVAECLGISEKEALKRLSRARDPKACAARLKREHKKRQREMVRRYQERTMERIHQPARDLHRQTRETECNQRRLRRQRMTLGARVDSALKQARVQSAASSGEIGSGTSPKPASSPPPAFAGTQLAGEDDVFTTYERAIRRLVERLEREIDT